MPRDITAPLTRVLARTIAALGDYVIASKPRVKQLDENDYPEIDHG